MRQFIFRTDEIASEPARCHLAKTSVAATGCAWFSGMMSLEALKREAAALDDQSRKELMAFLVALREKQWHAHARNVGHKLDDPDQSRWLTLEEFQTRLDQIPERPE